MKGFLVALVGDLLSINAIASVFLPGVILKEIDASEKMNIQTVISNSTLMFFSCSNRNRTDSCRVGALH
ncbi:MAG: hypothetical protein K6F69_11295 [Treponema sp.]|nr:hypothetical protein [Treponema sp.]